MAWDGVGKVLLGSQRDFETWRAEYFDGSNPRDRLELPLGHIALTADAIDKAHKPDIPTSAASILDLSDVPFYTDRYERGEVGTVVQVILDGDKDNFVLTALRDFRK